METKYIKFRPSWKIGDDDGDDFVVIFPGYVTHRDIARAMGDMYSAVSAGFVGNARTAYGESISLKLQSDPQHDNFLIASTLRGLTQ